MDSETKNLKVFKNKVNKNFMKKIKNINCYIWLFIFFIINILLFFFKINIIIINKNNIKEIDNIKNYIFNQNKILKNGNNILSNYINNNYTIDISEKIKILNLITNNNFLKYKGVHNCLLNDPDSQYCIYHLIYPKKVIGKNRVLIGEKRDGCYVLLDDFKDIKIAYSFGISKMIQFDKALADKGIDIYMYDHTINGLPYNNSKFHWYKIGIAGKNYANNKLKTLEELISKNGHNSEKNMILKIDVEYCEWYSLKDLPDNILNQFKYIVIEYHFKKLDQIKLYYDVLKKLHKNHQVFYLRCHGRHKIVTFGNNIICKYLEVSYIIKENNKFTKDDSIYPIFEFDFSSPNLKKRHEFNLNILKLFDD